MLLLIGKAMYLKIFIPILLFFYAFNLEAQQLDWEGHENDTLIAIGTYLLADKKIYMPKDSLLKNPYLTTNVEELEVTSFMMTAFSLGYAFEQETEGAALTINMKNAIQDKNINYKFVNFKKIQLTNLSEEIFVPKIEKIKIIFTD